MTRYDAVRYWYFFGYFFLGFMRRMHIGAIGTPKNISASKVEAPKSKTSVLLFPRLDHLRQGHGETTVWALLWALYVVLVPASQVIYYPFFDGYQKILHQRSFANCEQQQQQYSSAAVVTV